MQRKPSVNFFASNALVGSPLIPETVVRNQPDPLAGVLFRIRGRSENQTTLARHLVAGGQVSNASIDMTVNPAWPEGTGAADQELLASRLRGQIEILQTVAGGS